MSSSDDSDQDDQYDFSNELKSIRKSIDWEVEKERRLLFDRFRFLIRQWKGQLPNLRDIFRAEEIDWILSESVKSVGHFNCKKELTPLVQFVVKCGYKDKPQADEDGKPSPRRTTPIHHAARRQYYYWYDNISNLFKIYARFDVNYTDEEGFTHFHVACKYDCDDVVKKFLKLGQDPNLVAPKKGDSPLHLALVTGSMKVVKLLLKRGANPNLKNKNGETPLHIRLEHILIALELL
ncbi:ankyrin-1-like [Trichogramma pretiosum]|uniref:ankyrin-1-like n=1 Tax=Trichogramma pretiosum TaxID=7493 RepID=UPI000C71C0A4|nr:ankyrin-1-like [Trichogramma pretiosum]